MVRWHREITQNYINAGKAARELAKAQAARNRKRFRKITLLHSNDMHGDFMADEIDSRLVGGVSMLSGYLQKVRREEESVIYAVAGDMFRGSLIDSEFRGLSTIQIMNMLAPDVATVGNHEVDYGVGHMLFLEKCAGFPIVCANLRISTNHLRLFDPFRIVEVGGIRILFIGVVTEAILAKCRNVGYVGSYVAAEDPAREVGRICSTYNGPDVDLTVLLTHIGFEADVELAEQLDSAWGIDLIIGGHSHTLLDESKVVNGIPIVQVGEGTSHIGRLDIVFDTVRNRIKSCTWEAVPIDSTHCPIDEELEGYILKCKAATDEKYGQILVRLDRRLTHPARERETEIGDLFSDMLRDALGTDVFLVASGSIRSEELGPIVTKGDLTACLPFEESAHVVYMTGAQLRHAMTYMLRDKTLSGGHGEFFQVSYGLEIEYDQASHSLVRFDYEGSPVKDDLLLLVGLQHYFYENLGDAFDLSLDDLKKNHPARTAATSCADVIEETLLTGEYLDAKGEGRIVVHLAGSS